MYTGFIDSGGNGIRMLDAYNLHTLDILIVALPEFEVMNLKASVLAT